MRWETITINELDAVRRSGCEVSILPFGCLEQHGPHLALGIDGLVVHRLAELAADAEEAVVLPPLYYAMVPEQKGRLGTISIRPDILMTFVENICDEVARNGFRKILLLNGHGGNNSFFEVFMYHMLEFDKQYLLYSIVGPWELIQSEIDKLKETREIGREIGHACEVETSMAIYLFPELVRMDRVRAVPAGREDPRGISPARTAVDFPLNHPQICVGDASVASASRGQVLVKAYVERLARVIRQIKNDNITETVLGVMRSNLKASNFFKEASG